MKKIYSKNLNERGIKSLCKRTGVDFSGAFNVAKIIIEDVKNGGDRALINYAKKFDNVELDSLMVTEKEIETAIKKIPNDVKTAFKKAYGNIKKFHSGSLTTGEAVETMPGVKCFVQKRAIEKVGIYIPGGTAPLPSTVLMLGIPAQIAGCKEIIMCTPSTADIILFAANICGIKKIYKVGGAQAIAAMAYGTETIQKVYKIFGPGNQYVTAAKMLVSIDPQGAAIDMPAGPSEVLVIADKNARADFVASDLLSQAEHGVDSQAILVCTDDEKTEEIICEVNKQLKLLPRKETAEKALSNSFALVVSDINDAINFSNEYAPEHLIVNVKNPAKYISKISNAGSVFLGEYSCESAGDYASGTNHTLPTYGYAKAYSGVSVLSFQKNLTFQEISRKGAKALCPIVSKMAQQEGLDAHRKAMEQRLESVSGSKRNIIKPFCVSKTQ
ncbi:MAG: histidinol dehydrogenase [Candidatus Gracilibacteria bacterium]|jgi:histidinol dehydrogenase